MMQIQYPDAEPRVKHQEEKDFIFCLIRRKWLVITPEEWVRQYFILYLIDVMKYPRTLISVEKKVKLGPVEKRYDIVVYGKNTRPFVIVECKAEKINLSENTYTQVLQYNSMVAAPYFIITNGVTTRGFLNEDGIVSEIDVLPAYD